MGQSQMDFFGEKGRLAGEVRSTLMEVDEKTLSFQRKRGSTLARPIGIGEEA
jgi:hypothetical protein